MGLRLEKIQRDFLWGGVTLDSKPHLVKWDTVCSDRRMGGLGVRRLHLLNKAVLCKWIWRFASKREAFWRQIINGKYWDLEGGWCSKEVRGGYGVGLWKTIRKLWDVVSSNSSFSVGNGKMIKFWKDKWCGDEQLMFLFPLYLPFLTLKTLGWWSCGSILMRRVAGIPTSQRP